LGLNLALSFLLSPFGEDAEAFGKVIFRAMAIIENAPDAFPQDNERLSSLTIVKQMK